MFLYILVCFLFTTTSATYTLAAAAIQPSLLASSSDESTCIKTNGDIEFWVNTATNVRSSITKMVATGDMEINKLTVANLIVTGEIKFINENLFSKIASLEQTITSLEQRLETLED